MIDGKSIIYTAIAGGYDNLKPPRGDSPIVGWHDDLKPPRGDSPAGGPARIAFVDNPVLCAGTSCPGWQIEPMPSICMDPLMQAKSYKVLAHRVLPAGTEFSLWVDGSIEFNADLHPEALAQQFLADSDLALFRHHRRDCLYDEARTCQAMKLDDPAVMARQVNRYRAEGYPRNNGLSECTVILRRHTPAVARLDELWWQEINNGSRRDQLSFNYVCWKLGIRHSLLPGTMLRNPFFKRHPHARSRKMVDPGAERTET